MGNTCGCSKKEQANTNQNNLGKNTNQNEINTSLFIKSNEKDQQSYDKTNKKFKVHFQKIKIKNSPSFDTFVHVNFDNQHAFETPITRDENLNPTWRISHEFDYEVSDEKLKKKAFVQFIIKDKQKVTLGTLKIQLALVSTGPFHHDIKVHWKQVSQELQGKHDLKVPGRLQFDLKMSQEIEFELLPKRIHFNLLEGMKEKAYNFSYKVITPTTEYISEHSTNILNPDQNNYIMLASPSPSNVQNRSITQKQSQMSQYSQNKNGTIINQSSSPLYTDKNFDTLSTKAQQGLQGENEQVIYKNNNSNGNYLFPPANNDTVNVENKNKNKVRFQEPNQMNQIHINFNNTIHKNSNINGQNSFHGNTNISPKLPYSVNNLDATDKYHKKKRSCTIAKIDELNLHTFQAEEEFSSSEMEEKQKKIKPQGRKSAFISTADSSDNVKQIEPDETQKEKDFQKKHYLEWDFTKGDQFQVPDIVFDIYSKDIGNTTIQIILWGVQPNQQVIDYMKDEPDNQNEIEMPLFEVSIIGECYISLNKLLSSQGEITTNKKGDRIMERRHSYTEIIRKHGIQIGQVEGDFVLTNNLFLKQLLLGVMTELGIKKTSTAIYQPVIHDPSQFEQISLLSLLKEELIDSVFQFNQKKSGSLEKIKLRNLINRKLKSIQEILEKKHKESIKSFYYKSKEDLLNAQTVLIELATHLEEYSDEIDQVLRPLYYDCLRLVMNRGEFNLQYIGFNEEQRQFLQKLNSSVTKKLKFKEEQKIYKLKVKVGIEYQLLMFTILQKVLKKIINKALIEQEKQFVENFLAIAYFRIPVFREKLLNSIIKEADDSRIPEWRGTERLLEDSDLQLKGSDQNVQTEYFQSLFDWDVAFNDHMRNTQEGQQNYMYLLSFLEEKDWQQKIGKRSVAFFFFLNEWALYVNNTVIVKEQVPWYDLPGYKQIVKAFLLEMKQRNLVQYPDCLKLASVSMLNNEKLLNILVLFTFNKTSLYDSYRVIKSLELINMWLNSLQVNKKSIPTIFDFNFFLKGLCIVFHDEHSFTITQALWMLYNNFPLFPSEFRKELCNFLLGHMYYKLFMHWSRSVRNVFHFLLVYRINHLHRNQLTDIETLEDLQAQMILHNNSTNSAVQKKFKIKHEDKNSYINDYIQKHFARTQETIMELHKLKQRHNKLEQYETLNKIKNMTRVQQLKEKLKKKKEHIIIQKIQQAKTQDQIDEYQIQLNKLRKIQNHKKTVNFTQNIQQSASLSNVNIGSNISDSEDFDEDLNIPYGNNNNVGMLEQAIEQCRQNYNYKVRKNSADDSSLPDLSVMSQSRINITNQPNNYTMQCKSNINNSIRQIKRSQTAELKVIRNQSMQNQTNLREIKEYQITTPPKSPELNMQKAVSCQVNPIVNSANKKRHKMSCDNISVYSVSGSKKRTRPQNNSASNISTPVLFTRQSLYNSPQVTDINKHVNRKYSAQDFLKIKEFNPQQQTTMLQQNFLKENPLMIKRNLGYSGNNLKKGTEPSLDQIELQYLKYLDKAMEEYKSVKEGYLKWHAVNLKQIKSYSQQKQKKLMMELPVPEIKINLPLDEGEVNIKNEWQEW